MIDEIKISAAFLFVLLLLPQTLKAQDEAVPYEITLRDSVSLALSKNPKVLKAEEAVKQARADSRASFSKVFPTITGEITARHQKDASNSAAARFDGDAYNRYGAHLNASQPLFVRGLLSGLFGSGADRKIKELDLEMTKRDLTAEVLESFDRALLLQLKTEILLRSEQLEKEILATTEKRYRIGRSQKLDVLQIKTELALLAPKIEGARNDSRAALAELAASLGLKPDTTMKIKGDLEAPVWPEVQKKIEAVTPQVLEVEKANITRLRFENTQITSLSKHWPQLMGVGSLGRTGYKKDSLFKESATEWNIGLELTIPLFSGLSYWHERSSLGAAEQQLVQEEARVQKDFLMMQVKAKQDLDSIQTVMTSSKVALELARDTVKEAHRTYKLSSTDYLQVLKSEQSLLDAELSFLQARFDYIQALKTYFSVSGYPLYLLVDSLGRAG